MDLVTAAWLGAPRLLSNPARTTREGAVVAYDRASGRGRVSVGADEFKFDRSAFNAHADRDPLPGEVVSVTLHNDRVERITAHWEDA